MIWYRQINPTSWVAYNGSQAIAEETTEGALLRTLRSMGIREPVRNPLRLQRVV